MPDHPLQRELVRILHGGRTRAQAMYVTRAELTETGRATWIAWLNSVALVR